MAGRSELLAAASTWNKADEDIELTNKRIHGGVSEEKLTERADRFILTIFNTFPYVHVGPSATIMEIGSGTGYLMEAMNRLSTRLAEKAPPRKIIGLDIAEHMLAKAKKRLGGVPPYEFVHYDGLRPPIEDNSIDLIYSCAALQHVPKLYVYNLFFEIRRMLKPNGFSVIHLSSFRQIPKREILGKTWRLEISNQIKKRSVHWMHYYNKEELDIVLSSGTGFGHVDVREDHAVWLCVSKTPLSLGEGTSLSLGDGANPFS